jgi:hypothetical protein
MSVIFFIAAAIVGILPALLVFVIGQTLANQTDDDLRQQKWALFWLEIAALIMIPFAIFAPTFLTSPAGLVLALVAPTLWGALGLLLMNLRSLREVMRTRRTLVVLLLLWLLVSLIITALGDVYIALFVLVPSLLVALVWGAGRKLDVTALLLISLLLAAILLLDAFGALANHDLFIQPRLRSLYEGLSALTVVFALGFSAVWVYRAYQPPPAGTSQRALYLGMAALLVLSACAVVLRHGLLTKATGRAAEDHFPFNALASALVSGLVLALSLKSGSRRVALAYLFVVPVLIVVTFSIGFSMNPVAITEARLSRINQAIQSYKQDIGVYPPDLATLVPGYAKTVLGPLTGRGQVWCYQAGNDFYRLGYVWFQRYYNYPDGSQDFTVPYYEIKVPYAAGTPPSGEWMCDQELRSLKRTGGL